MSIYSIYYRWCKGTGVTQWCPRLKRRSLDRACTSILTMQNNIISVMEGWGRPTDLSLHVTKQTVCAIGHSIGAMVATERHLGLNLTGIKERDSFSPWCSRAYLVTQSTPSSVGSERLNDTRKISWNSMLKSQSSLPPSLNTVHHKIERHRNRPWQVMPHSAT